VLEVATEVVLPVMIVILIGGAVGHWRGILAEPISTLVLYIFTPALVFKSLSETQLPSEDVLRIVAVHCVIFLLLYGISAAWSSIAGHDRQLRSALALVATIPNSGNMGLPIALLAYGRTGFEVAVVFWVVTTALVATAGVMIGAFSTGPNLGALRAPLRFPLLYGAIAGLAVNISDVDLPPILESPIGSLADATIPAMLVVLGLQLRNSFRAENLVNIIGASILRLFISPLIAYLATMLFGINGVSQSTIIVLAATPTGIITTIIASEFDVKPGFVSGGVFVTTAASVVSLTVLIAILG
jgi:predicted permease